MSREVMQQALDAIEDSGCKADLMAAADALRAALAEQNDDLTAAWMAGAAEERKRAEQAQPVAWGAVVESGGSLICASSTGHSGTPIPVGTLIYTTPPAPVVPQPLTDEDIEAIPCTDGDGSDWEALLRFARAVEAAVLERMGVQR